jgi:hypothetical protein
MRGERKLLGENKNVVWAEFSTLGQAVFVISAVAMYIQTHPYTTLKTRPRFCPVSLSLSVAHALLKNITLKLRCLAYTYIPAFNYVIITAVKVL